MLDAYLERRIPDGDMPYSFEIERQCHPAAGMGARPHYHNYVEILFCESGLYEARLGNDLCTFGGGDLVLIHSQEIHSIEAKRGGDNSYIVVKFIPELLFSPEQSALELKYLLAFTLGVTTNQRIFRGCELEGSDVPALILELLRENEARGYGYEIAVRIGLCRLFLWILRQWNRQGVAVAAVTDVDADDLRVIQKVFDYVEYNYSGKIRMEDVARSVGKSYSAFSKFFTRHIHKHFADYLNEVRVTKSKILLATTAMNITQIAMEVGFSTTSYFIQCFKSRMAVTPQQFRRQFSAPAEAG